MLFLFLVLMCYWRVSIILVTAIPENSVVIEPSTALVIENSSKDSVSCEKAHFDCYQRTGCGMALKNFIFGCAELRAGQTSFCSDHCQKSLIALISTEEGAPLVECDCNSDASCEKARSQMEVCRPDVLKATANASIVSCSVAQWICSADAECGTALKFYNDNCKGMFEGHKCTKRCRNSIDILQRQNKAEKLETCYCDGSEGYNCEEIRRNMVELCGVRLKGMKTDKEEETTVNDVSSSCSVVTQISVLSVVLAGFQPVIWNT